MRRDRLAAAGLAPWRGRAARGFSPGAVGMALALHIVLLGGAMLWRPAAPPAPPLEVTLQFEPAPPEPKPAPPQPLPPAPAPMALPAPPPSVAAPPPPTDKPPPLQAAEPPMPAPPPEPALPEPPPELAEVPDPPPPPLPNPPQHVALAAIAPLPPRPVPVRKAETAPVPAAPMPRPADASAPSQAAAAPAAVVAPSWEGKLTAWLYAHRIYPESARRRGVQGTVIARFTVERTGQVESVAIAQPSGWEVLDQSVVAMLDHAALPAFPDDMPQPRITVTVPVRFNLTR